MPKQTELFLVKMFQHFRAVFCERLYINFPFYIFALYSHTDSMSLKQRKNEFKTPLFDVGVFVII